MIEILMSIALAFSAAFPGVGWNGDELDPDGQPKVHDIMETRATVCDAVSAQYTYSFAWGGRRPCNR